MTAHLPVQETLSSGLDFLWAEITGRCQLACGHCYSDSGPRSTHGIMTPRDWMRVIDEAAAVRCRSMQFIGGEPTLHPALPALVRHALRRGMAVEVYSNLVQVTPGLWGTFELPGVSLATSYYSSDATQHDAITGRRSHGRTWANIVEATRRGIALRVGMVAIVDGQHVDAAVAQLRDLGITGISVDRVRRVGRGRGGRDTVDDPRELCGQCARAQLMVAPDRTAHPCTMVQVAAAGQRESRIPHGDPRRCRPGAARPGEDLREPQSYRGV
jgi:MoaA/NifB/PqqE/SkfB family radical SAM enzyme